MIVRRLLVTIPMLFGASLIIFFVLRLIPGDPATAILGSHSSPALVRQVRDGLGLNKPIYVQFGDWISKILLHGNFGQDYITSQSISSEMASRLPVTLELSALAFIGSVIVAIPAGVLAAVHRGGWTDRVIQFISVVTIAIPDFVFGILGILLFALVLKLVPSSGFIPFGTSPWENIQSLALPAIALALGFAGVLARVTRSGDDRGTAGGQHRVRPGGGHRAALDRLPARAAQRGHPGRDRGRDAGGLHPGLDRGHRDAVRRARDRPGSRAGHAEPGLHGHAGLRADLRRGLHPR